MVPIDSSGASMSGSPESLDDVFRLKVDKGERAAAYTGRCRELFEKAAREGIELPDVARGYLMLRGARLGPERKAIVLAAAGQSYTERNVAQALREAPMGNARDAAEERRIRRKGENAKVWAPRRRPSSWRRRMRRGGAFGIAALPKKLWRTGPRASQFSFQVRWGWTFLFSSLFTAQIREEHACYGCQGPLYLFDPCRLGLFLAYCAKGSNRSNFWWIPLPRWPGWKIASYLCGARKTCFWVSQASLQIVFCLPSS